VPESPVWQPSASPDAVRSRAELLRYLRDFFARRQVLEVETPVLGRCGVTDPHLDGLAVSDPLSGIDQGWLQTSPEYHMKRLLAAGHGAIYQVSRVFRAGERGRRHNPEFSMLEWYRPGFDDRDLMKEVADLVCGWLNCPRPDVIPYRDAMIRWAEIDPFTAETPQICERVSSWLDARQAAGIGRDGCLDLLMSYCVEPALAKCGPAFIADYPASQAALARVNRAGEYPVAHRFELYVSGMELCNGYWELADVGEQRDRFEQDNALRGVLGKSTMQPDQALLQAMGHGLPDCAGVALGLDRLLMLRLGTGDIRDVLTFPTERA
jgi:lysyl-tRNA synthetase class 2